MTKLSPEAFRKEILVHGLLFLGLTLPSWLLYQGITITWIRLILMGQFGFCLVVGLFNLYTVFNAKAFKRALTARNDERYQLIQHKAEIFGYRSLLFLLGLVVGFEGAGQLFGSSSLVLGIWEFALLMMTLNAVTYALAKLYYQHRL